MFEKAVTYQYITNVLTTGVATDLDTLLPGMGAFVTDAGGLAGAAALGTQNLRYAQRLGNGQLVFSPYINADSLVRANLIAAVAPTPHVVVFGSGDVGLGTIIAGDTYTLSLTLDYTQGGVNNTPFVKTIPYRAQTADTQLEVARGLFDAALNIVNRNLPERKIQVGRAFTPGDPGDLVAGVADTTVTYGSINAAMVAHALAAGDVILLDGDAYIVADVVDADNFQLDRAYQGASATIALADIDSILAADVPAGVWGIGFAGLDRSFNPITSMYNYIRFSVQSTGFDDDVETQETAGTPGQGTYAQVAQQEVYSAMNEGNPYIKAYPPTQYRLEADPANTYLQYVIECANDAFEAVGTGQKPVSQYKIIIAVESTLAADIARVTLILGL